MKFTIVNCKFTTAAAAALAFVLRECRGGGPATPVDAAKAGHVAAVRAELQKKVDVNAASSDGSTALHWAVHRDALDVVDLLLAAGANPKAANRYGVTPSRWRRPTATRASWSGCCEAAPTRTQRCPAAKQCS